MRKDNLQQYREEKVKNNLELVKKAIKHLRKYNIEITLSNVSKITYDLTSEEQKGLSISALSKNKIYKDLIEQEKNNDNLPNEQKKTEFSSRTLKEMSEAELIAEIYKLRSSIIQKDKEITVFKDLFSEYKIDKNNTDKHESNDKELYFALEHILAVLLEKEILYIDKKSFDVKLSVYNNKILNGSLFKKIFPEESNYENNEQRDSK